MSDLRPNSEPCPVCGRVMMYRGGLVFHAKQAHDLDMTPGVAVPGGNGQVRPEE